MFKQQSDISGNPYFVEFHKAFSSQSFSKKEKRSNAHIWNLYEDQSNVPLPTCSYCHVVFNSLVQWHAHMICFVHVRPALTEEEAIKQHVENLVYCKFCKQDVLITTVKDHRCLLTEKSRLDDIINKYNVTYCPLICILCKTVKTFTSQAALQIHIVIKHSPLKDPDRCSLCNATFKTNDINVHEAHAVDIHGPELNLIYWKLTEPGILPKISKSDGIKYVCALSNYSPKHDKDKQICSSEITDIFQLTIHTLCFHGYEPFTSFLDKTAKEEAQPVPSSFLIPHDVVCRYCGQLLPNILYLNHHIESDHMLEILLRKDYITKKRLFNSKIPLNLTCLICMTVYGGSSELQIHLMVRHSNNDFGFCGMCNKDLIIKRVTSSKLIWRAIQYHETLHLQQLKHYKKYGIFHELLIPPPVLYKSNEHFGEDLERRRNVRAGALFDDEQIAFFKILGRANYEHQVNMEIFDS